MTAFLSRLPRGGCKPHSHSPLWLSVALAASVVLTAPLAAQQQSRIQIRVASGAERGPMTPMWAWFGYDEPNYTYMPNGKKLLSALAEAAKPATVYVRT